MRLTASTTCAGPNIQPSRSAASPWIFENVRRHDDVVGGGDKLDAGLVIVAPDIFGVGGVEHEQHVRRQAAVQPLDLVERQIGAGRIVGIGEKDDLGLLRHRREDRVDVGRVSWSPARPPAWRRCRAWRSDRPGSRAWCGSPRRRRRDRRAPGGSARSSEPAPQTMRSGSSPKRRPIASRSFVRRAVRIILQMRGDGLIGRDRARARAERRLVRRQLEYFGDARGAALAGHIGLDVEHAGPGHGDASQSLHILSFGPRSRADDHAAPYSGSRGCRRGPSSGSTRRCRSAPRRRRRCRRARPK